MSSKFRQITTHHRSVAPVDEPLDHLRQLTGRLAERPADRESMLLSLEPDNLDSFPHVLQPLHVQDDAGREKLARGGAGLDGASARCWSGCAVRRRRRRPGKRGSGLDLARCRRAAARAGPLRLTLISCRAPPPRLSNSGGFAAVATYLGDGETAACWWNDEREKRGAVHSCMFGRFSTPTIRSDQVTPGDRDLQRDQIGRWPRVCAQER